MNYGELQQLVIDYMHRADLTDRVPGFVELAHSRIMRDLRAPAMIKDETFSVTQNPMGLPEGFIDVRELSYTNGSRRYALTSVGRAAISRATGDTGSLPCKYSIVGDTIEIQPETLADYRLIYWKKLPFFTSDTDTSEILDNYPYLYLYGSLIEANSYIQDGEQRVKAIEFYQTEIGEVNAETTATRYGEAPQIGAM
jgi:hypothetical protein